MVRGGQRQDYRVGTPRASARRRWGSGAQPLGCRIVGLGCDPGHFQHSPCFPGCCRLQAALLCRRWFGFDRHTSAEENCARRDCLEPSSIPPELQPASQFPTRTPLSLGDQHRSNTLTTSLLPRYYIATTSLLHCYFLVIGGYQCQRLSSASAGCRQWPSGLSLQDQGTSEAVSFGPHAALRFGPFGLRISAFFRPSGFGLRTSSAPDSPTEIVE
jgi:hypothetical protein